MSNCSTVPGGPSVTYRVALVQRLAVLLQSVQELHVVLSLVGEVRDCHVQLLP